MSLRTPRRRISPRARRRYRAIRNFFRRTFSSLASLSGNKIISSTTENVTSLNRSGMMGHQLHTVPQNYRGNVYRTHTEDLTPKQRNSPNSPMQRRRRFSVQEFIPNGADTRVLYKTPDNLCSNSHECGLRYYDDHSDMEPQLSDRINYARCSSSHVIPIQRPRKNKQNLRENHNQRNSRLRKRGPIITENSASGFDSYESLRTLSNTGPGHTYRDSVPQKKESYSHNQPPGHEARARGVQPPGVKIKRIRDKPKRHTTKSPHASSARRKKRRDEPLASEEQQFIAEIINRQYKPVSFFGRRASDISQISTPVCRDQRFSAREIIPDSEISLASPGPTSPDWKYYCEARVRDKRSLCDTRLRSGPRPARQRRHRTNNYNDSKFYDVVPVKEKTSPNSRRKFIADNLVMNEVPPSPRTLRPRLNLETQKYCQSEEYEQHENQTRIRRSPNRKPEFEYIQTFTQDVSTEESPRNTNEMSPNLMRLNNTTRLHDDIGTTMSSQPYLSSRNNTANNTLNDSKARNGDDTVDIDKTDKALSEIKNILQSFLQELKKDSSTSQCGRANGSDKNSGKPLNGTPQGSDNETSNTMKNSAGSFINYGLGQGHTPAMPPPFMPSYHNPCCYPQVIPMYGAHGVPYLVASPSCVCASAACGHNHPPPQTDTRDTPCRTCSKVNCTEPATTKSNCETDLLIREIYNYVARNPNIGRKESTACQNPSPRRKPSMGNSMQALHQDANVGTAPLRCYSKSCEAIVSRQMLDTYYATYPTCSDSKIEENLSREAVMDYQMPRETNEYRFKDKRVRPNLRKQHSQDSKFTSALRLLRKHNKNNRKERIHEVCHSEQSIEVDVIPKKHYFNQEFATYAMYGQELLRPPLLRHDPRFPPTYDYDNTPYEPPMHEYCSPRPASEKYPYYDCMPPEGAAIHNPYEQMSPGMQTSDLCFKEVEVKSIGTQCQKKTSFRMFSQKKDSEAPESQRRPLVSILRGDRTEDTKVPEKKPEKSRKLFNIKPKAEASKSEPMAAFTERIQKDLTKNDKTVANAMLKKLFYKRNPFSPQNRFVRTIMEKDAPVYKWRPRMFVF